MIVQNTSEKNPSRKLRSEVSEIVLSPWTFLKVVSQLGNGHGARDEQREITNIFKSYYLHIKCFLTNSLAVLM